MPSFQGENALAYDVPEVLIAGMARADLAWIPGSFDVVSDNGFSSSGVRAGSPNSEA
jgi:hypothetical protein